MDKDIAGSPDSSHIVKCSIAGHHSISMIIDSGAEINVITETDWERIKRDGSTQLYDLNMSPELNLRAYASTSNLVTLCIFKAWISAEEKRERETFAEFAVVVGGTKSLLGRRTAMEMRLLAIGLEVHELEVVGEEFPTIPNVEVNFDVDESVLPVRHAYVSIPAHYRQAANERLRAMELAGIIEPVKEAPRWISGMSAVPKGKGDFRLIVNMRGPNKAIQRQYHQMPRIEEMKTKLVNSRFFTKLDLKSAFHHVAITEKSRELTTFMAPNGMFRFKRLVFGVNCAPEIFQRIMEGILSGIGNVIVYIDDILIFASTLEQLRNVTKQVMSALELNNLTMNEEKCVREVEQLTFLGHRLSAQGLNIDEQKVSDVKKFREPRSLSELKSFLGLASYVSTYIPRYADLTEPLWRVAKESCFVWTQQQSEAFNAVKEAIVGCTTAQGYFNTNDETFLYTDASPHALGAVLTQKNQQGEFRIVSFASKTLTKTERRYAQTQREALAVVWATEHFYYYLLGHKFTIRTDAEGIAYIFNRNGSEPKRLLRRAEGWAMRLDSFDFTIEFVKGSLNIADPSSRLYEGSDEEYVEGEAPCEIAQISHETPGAIRFGEEHMPPLEVSYQSSMDDEFKAVAKALQTDIWEPALSAFEAIKEELREEDGIITRLGLAVIPKALRNKALMLSHKGHPGISKMKSILRERVWWPSMGRAVEEWVESCTACTLNGRREPPTPMVRTRMPDAPWDLLAVDFCGPFNMYGGIYVLVLLDYFSRYMTAMTVKSTDLASTLPCFEKIFDTLGLPRSIKSDNGPPFNSHGYKDYCNERGISPVFSWPLTPQQNGMAERAMQTINKAMQSASVEGRDYQKSLAEAVRAHNTAVHRTTNTVPSDLMFARKLRRSLPLTSSAVFTPNYEEIRNRDYNEKQKAKEREDRKRGARESRIMIGDKVVLRRGTKQKGQTNYAPEELEVTQKRKGDLTMTGADGRTVKRHITMAKKMTTKTAQSEAEAAPEQGSGRPKREIKIPKRFGMA